MRDRFFLIFLLGFLLPAFGCSRPEAPTGIVLVTVDTLRADRLGCYGYPYARTPVVDRWAGEGVLFEQCVAPAPLTLPSHASMMTGQYPLTHGVRHNGLFTLPSEALTLAEQFRERPADTAAFIGAFPVHSSFGLDQGFERYDEDFEAVSFSQTGYYGERNAEAVMAQALPWLEARAGKPFFLWIHLFDPHTPYAPPESFLPHREPGTTRESRRAWNAAAYDGEIAYVDQVLSGLDDVLRRDAFQNTLLLFTSDHGEALGEHGEPTHGVFLYEATMRVPLIVWSPSPRYKPRRIHERVGLVDLTPTLCDVAGLPIPSHLDGRSLRPWLEGNTRTSDWDYFGESMAASYDYAWAPPRAVWRRDWKYIDLPRPELYHLGRDPRETQNLHGTETAPFDLPGILAARAGSGGPEEAPISPDSESIEKLRSLGYMGQHGSRQSQSQTTDRDPKDFIRTLELVEEAENEAAAGQLARAESLFEEAAALDSTNYVVGTAGLLFFDLTRNAEKLQHYSASLMAQGYDTSELQFYRGRAAELAGHFEAAEAAYRRAMEGEPPYPSALAQLGVLMAKTKRPGEAERLFKKALEARPGDGLILEDLGVLYFTQKRFDESVKALERAIETGRHSARGLNTLGMAQLNLGKTQAAMLAFQSAAVAEPAHPDAYFHAARLLLSLGKNDEAWSVLNALLQHNHNPVLQTEVRAWMGKIS